MRALGAAIGVVVIGVGLGGCGGRVREQATTEVGEPKWGKQDPPVALQAIHERGVQGKLGVRLGTIVEIAGVVVPNTWNMKAYSAEPFLLRIEEVDGGQLKAAVEYPLGDKNRELEKTLKIDGRFRLVGYETGDFRGSPDGEFKYVPAYSTTGYGFHTEFVVLAVK